jgi:hypothetical protein
MAEKEVRVQVIANWALATTANTADQQIGTRVSRGFEAYVVTSIVIEVYRTVVSAVATLLGTISLRLDATAWITLQASNNTASSMFGAVIPIPKGQNIPPLHTLDAVCTPADATSTTWRAIIIGYEK